MMPAIDIKGKRYGRLIVVERSHTGEDRRVYWRCKCDCGTETISLGQHLRRGSVKSCGCLLVEPRHGHARRGKKSPEYLIWVSMHQRCTNPKNKKFEDYGGRGITVCEEWNCFEKFLQDMGERPTTEHTIDRIDNNGGYFLGNCRWATPAQQSGNRRQRRWGKRPVPAPDILMAG